MQDLVLLWCSIVLRDARTASDDNNLDDDDDYLF